MEDEVHLELGEDALEQVDVQDGAQILMLNVAADVGIEGSKIEGDDGLIAQLRDPLDEAVADFAAGPGDEDDGFLSTVASLALA